MKEFILISEFAFVVMTTIFAFAFLIDWGAKQVTKRIKKIREKLSSFVNP